MCALTIRDNYLKAVTRENPEWVPWYTWLTEAWEELLEEKTGRRDYTNYFEYPWRHPSRPQKEVPKREPEEFAKYYEDIEMPEGSYITGMGVLHTPGSLYHFTHRVAPLRNATTLKEVEEFPWPHPQPDYTDAEIDDMRAQVEKIKADGWVASGWGGGCFEAGWAMNGMDNMLMEMMTGGEMGAYILDWFTERGVKNARLSAMIGCDEIGGGDDVGMQDRMMMDPDLWRKEMKPRVARIFAAAKEIKPDIHIAYHSDGYIEPIIPDLIETGVDILNPIQPECMDQEKIKREYGDRLCLQRCIGTQTVLPFWSPDRIEAQVKWTIDVLGEGGGLIIGPTHSIEPDVPWESFVAFYRAVLKYGGYENYPGEMPEL